MDAAVPLQARVEVATEDRAGLDRAYRLLWLAVLFDVLAFGVGFAWDRAWHASHPFEDFFSPPHLFVYSLHLCATITLAYITFQPTLRSWFGDRFRLWPFAFTVPGPIALAGGGFVVTAMAGFFDGIWHSVFGLDETGWSFPHSMLGWGIFIAFVGIVSCRIALARWKPVGVASGAVMSLLLLATSVERFAGPLWNNLTPNAVRFVAQLPVLAAEPAFQHTARIYLAYDITRWNPLFIPLASLGVGLGLALVRRLDRRPLLLLALGAFLTWTTTYVPLVVPALVLALRGGRAATRTAWLVAGLSLGVATAIVWHGTPVGIVLAAPLMLAGAALADRVWTIVERPARRPVLWFVALAGVGAPMITGVIDLVLRSRTP